LEAVHRQTVRGASGGLLAVGDVGALGLGDDAGALGGSGLVIGLLPKFFEETAEIAIHEDVQDCRVDRCDHECHQNEQRLGCGKPRGIFIYNINDNVMDEVDWVAIGDCPT
jgi:hypothetical protein